jgi:hypothetical protein
MKWFMRDSKIYVGPVADSQIDVLQTRPLFERSGVACRAGNGTVELYLTLPADSVPVSALDRLKFGDVFA